MTLNLRALSLVAAMLVCVVMGARPDLGFRPSVNNLNMDAPPAFAIKTPPVDSDDDTQPMYREVPLERKQSAKKVKSGSSSKSQAASTTAAGGSGSSSSSSSGATAAAGNAANVAEEQPLDASSTPQERQTDVSVAPFHYWTARDALKLRKLNASEMQRVRQADLKEPLQVPDLKDLWIDHCDIDRVKASEISYDEFKQKYIMTGTPVVIEGEMEDWLALKKWKFAHMKKKRRNLKVRLGKDRMVKMKKFIKYAESTNDYDPVMIFMNDFFDIYPTWIKEYKQPKYFPEEDNFLHSISRNIKPDYRWWIVAPAGSGSQWHLDPFNTSAWNALSDGVKRWELYPPTTYVPPGMYREGKNHRYESTDDSGTIREWVAHTLPHLSADKKPLECLQKTGDVIFVPGGWWHAVLNLEHTSAVTQNFMNDGNFRAVLDEMKYAGNQPHSTHLAMCAEYVIQHNKDKYPERFTQDDLDYVAPFPPAGEGPSSE